MKEKFNFFLVSNLKNRNVKTIKFLLFFQAFRVPICCVFKKVNTFLFCDSLKLQHY